MCRGLLLYLVTYIHTHTHTHTHPHKQTPQHTHTHSERVLCIRDWPVLKKTHITHKNQTTILSAGHEPAIPASGFDRKGTGIGFRYCRATVWLGSAIRSYFLRVNWRNSGHFKRKQRDNDGQCTKSCITMMASVHNLVRKWWPVYTILYRYHG